MSRIRLGSVAWLLFALACLVPGWFLSEWLAAEVQIENARPPIGRADWRKLWSPGVSRLCDVLLEDASVERRVLAATLLAEYDGSMAWRARLGCLSDPDARVSRAAFSGRHPEGIPMDGFAAAIEQMDDEELCRAMAHPIGPLDRGMILYQMWRLAPHTTERIVSSILRTTDDLELAQHVTSDTFGYGCFGFRLCDMIPEVCEARNRALGAGLENPHAAIREPCMKRLAEEAGTNGAK